MDYEAHPRWSTTDDTHYFNATYGFDPSVCLSPATVPVTKFQLIDLNNDVIYNCPYGQFDTSGVIHFQCTRTLGQIASDAEAAANGDEDDCKYLSLTE